MLLGSQKDTSEKRHSTGRIRFMGKKTVGAEDFNGLGCRWVYMGHRATEEGQGARDGVILAGFSDQWHIKRLA